MKFKIEPQSPDGVNISVEDILIDTLDEAKKFMEFCIDTWGGKPIDLEECERLYNSVTETDGANCEVRSC